MDECLVAIPTCGRGVIECIIHPQNETAEPHDNEEMIFIYMGGDQFVPRDVRRVRIDKSVTIIPRRAFEFRRRLIL